MARRQKKRAETLIIAREEWDMAHLCPPKELSICWAYEFTREYVRQGNPVPISAFWRLPEPLAKKGKNTEWLIATSYLLAVSMKPSCLRRKKPPPGVLEWLTRYSLQVLFD
jgi:hypothetical protein